VFSHEVPHKVADIPTFIVLPQHHATHCNTLQHTATLYKTQAVFFHEVPHNVADFAILISNGFSRMGALQAQWASAVSIPQKNPIDL